MDARKVIRDFYHQFELMDLEGVIRLFTPHATIDSPTLGKKEAPAFYRELFSKTRRIKKVIKDIFVNPDNPHRAAALVTVSWETKTGESMSFEGVVIFDVTQENKIQHLQIIYDAHRAREALSNT